MVFTDERMSQINNLLWGNEQTFGEVLHIAGFTHLVLNDLGTS